MPIHPLRRLVAAAARGAALVVLASLPRVLPAQQMLFGHGTDNQAIAQYYYSYNWGNVFHWHDCNYGPTEPCGPGPQSDVNSLTSAIADGSYGWASLHLTADGPQPNARSGDSHANAYWWDNFTVTSASLPVGTLVPIDLSLHFSASLNNSREPASSTSLARSGRPPDRPDAARVRTVASCRAGERQAS
ncbi:MAG: hypothetical protein HY275_13860 [Gemmatimonadetes bacterium]|nr:hypothetical protein [Gemmatimonadota bacterium]